MSIKTNQDILNELNNVFKKYSISSLGARMLVLDLALLGLDQENAYKYIEQHNLYPGYSKYFSTFALLDFDLFCGGPSSVSSADVATLNDVLNDICENALNDKNIDILSAMGLAQRDWQKKYIIKTYLFSLFLRNQKIKPLYKQLNVIDINEMISLCLLPKFFSLPKTLLEIVKLGIEPHVIFDNILKYVVCRLNYVTIELEDFRKRQNEKLINSQYNPFYARMIIKDYPVVQIGNGLYVFSSYFYLQDALVSRTIREIADNGKNSKIIGDVYEEIIFNSFEQMYSHCDKRTSSEKFIQLNPSTKKSGELCDILICKNGKYLLIDCKAKEMIEEVFQTNSIELDALKDKFEQRIKRINDINNGKFDKFIPKGTPKENIYSVIALMDDGAYSKNTLFNNYFKELSNEDKDFFNKHIHLISFEDLLNLIITDVDLFELIERSIQHNKYENHLALNIDLSKKNQFNQIFDNWYKKSIDDLKKFVVDNSLLDK